MSFSLNNKDTKINNDLFNVSTKESLSTAKNENFYKSFFTANRVTYFLGLFGQFLSAVTEFIFIARACGGELPIWQSSNIIPTGVGLGAVFFFEVIGVRVYLVRIVRQIANKESTSIQAKILLIFNIVFCLSILGANFGTSLVGQSTTFVSVKSSVDNSDTITKIKTALNAQIDTLTTRNDRKNTSLTSQSDKEIQRITDTYEPIIKDLKASKWVKGANKAKFNKKINEANAEKLTKIEVITADLKQSIVTNDTTLIEAIERAQSVAQIKIDAINKSDNSDLQIFGMIEKYSYWLLIVFMSLSILAIIYREVFISGSQQAVELHEVKKRPVLIFALVQGLYLKFYHLCYWIVVKIIGSKSFDYSRVMQEKDDYYSSDVSDNNLLKSAINGLKIGKKKEIALNEIQGFQNNVTNCDTTELNRKKQLLKKYKVTTLQMQYKRSNLVQKSESKTAKAQQDNTNKYLEGKRVLEPLGVVFQEKKNSVSINI